MAAVKPLVAVLLALACCPRPARAQAAPQITAILTDSALMYYLESVAETAHVETARCLMGRIRGDSVWILAAVDAPWLILAQSDSAVDLRPVNCPPGTVAIWHNHVRAWTQQRYGTMSCYLGRGDAVVLQKRITPPIAIVSVRLGVSCTFVRLPSGDLVAIPTVR